MLSMLIYDMPYIYPVLGGGEKSPQEKNFHTILFVK